MLELLLPLVSVRRELSPGLVGRAEEEEEEPFVVVEEVEVEGFASSAGRALRLPGVPGLVGKPFGPVGTALEDEAVAAAGREEEEVEAAVAAVVDFDGASDLVAAGDDAFDGAGVAAGVGAGVGFGVGAGLLIQCFLRFEMTAL